jgi:hypothetical protein
MAATKTRPLSPLEPGPTPESANQALNDLVFFALPAPLFRELSSQAAKRQMTLAQLLSTAVEEYLLKTDPNSRKVGE